MTALVLFYYPEDLGAPATAPYFKRIRIYNNKLEAFNAYAETSCAWSELVEFDTEEELQQKVKVIEKNLLEGKYNDYM